MERSRHTIIPEPLGDGLTLRDSEFESLRDLVYRESGIALAPAKRQLLASRLARRLRHFGYRTFAEYFDHLSHRDPSSEERQRMINCITTNKTEFFREPHHFDFLRDVAIPEWVARSRGGTGRVRVWSAGCSTGMEPYTIAITLLEHLAPHGIGFEVHATDIDTDVLAAAERGVYSEDDVGSVPASWVPKYFLRGYGTEAGLVQVRKNVQSHISFRRLNLIEPGWGVRAGLDAIFCRNVVIYFDRPTQQRLFDRYADHLVPDGFLFVGHSENLQSVTHRFTPLGGTVYRRTGSSHPAPGTGAGAVTGPAHPPRPTPVNRDVSIVAGEVYASREPTTVRTVLGSCVAACLYDPVSGVGGMNHFLLPGGARGENRGPKFGTHAMEQLIQKIVTLGGDRRRLRAKVFGAGNVIPGMGPTPTVGDRNAQFVRSFLDSEGIPLTVQLLGEPNGLQVHFCTNSGRAWVKPLARAQSQAVVADEQQYEGRLIELADRA